MRFQDVHVGDLQIAFATAGEGPPLVLLHGGWGDHRYWRRQLEGLNGDFAVAAWDTPGCGRSSDPPAGWEMADYADCLAAWLDAVGLERPHVVGASLGGMIAQRMAIDHPERVVSLASLMSTTGAPGIGEPTAAATEVLMSAPASERQAYIDGAAAARKVLGSVDGLRDDDLVREVAARAYDRGIHPPGTARQLAAIAASPDRTPELGRLNLPTVVIHGLIDPLIGCSGGEATAAAIPGARLVLIEGMGHDLPPGVWDQVVDALVANFERAAALAP